jgi:hypothetical protein
MELPHENKGGLPGYRYFKRQPKNLPYITDSVFHFTSESYKKVNKADRIEIRRSLPFVFAEELIASFSCGKNKNHKGTLSNTIQQHSHNKYKILPEFLF